MKDALGHGSDPRDGRPTHFVMKVQRQNIWKVLHRSGTQMGSYMRPEQAHEAAERYAQTESKRHG